MMRRWTIVLLVVSFLAVAPLLVLGETVVFPAIRSVTDPIAVQTTATTGAGNIVALQHRLAYTSVWVLWNGTCSGGVVEVQVAATTAGPWVTVATLTNKTNLPDWVLLVGSPGAIRASITTTVVGGTISAWITGW